MPGAQLVTQYQYPAASVVARAGTLLLCPHRPVHLNNQAFYVALFETSGASLIGLDTSSNGFSYQNTSGSWVPRLQLVKLWCGQ